MAWVEFLWFRLTAPPYTPPHGSITRKPCFGSLDLAPRAVKKFVASVEIFTGCNVAATLQAGRRLARRGLYNGTGSM